MRFDQKMNELGWSYTDFYGRDVYSLLGYNLFPVCDEGTGNTKFWALRRDYHKDYWLDIELDKLDDFVEEKTREIKIENLLKTENI